MLHNNTIQRYELDIPPSGIRYAVLASMLLPLTADTIITVSNPFLQLEFEEIGVVVDRAKRNISGPAGVTTPTETEFEIVDFLASSADQVQKREDIIKYVWPNDKPEVGHVLHVHVSNVRKKLYEEAGIPKKTIRTLHGVGFLFDSKPYTEI